MDAGNQQVGYDENLNMACEKSSTNTDSFINHSSEYAKNNATEEDFGDSYMISVDLDLVKDEDNPNSAISVGTAMTNDIDFMPLFHTTSSVENYDQHEIVIVNSNDITTTGKNGVEDDDESNEPTAKRVCIEEAQNGQTYVRVEQDDGNTIVIAVSTEDFLSDKPLALDMSSVNDTYTSTSQSSQSPVLSTNADDESDPKDSELDSLELDVTQAWFTTKDDKSALHHKGYNWKTGQWSREEIDVLQSNINGYCKMHGVNDPTEIIFEMSKDERKDFYRTVARGLQRPLFSVYRRVIRMYDQRNHIGKYSPEELERLRHLRQLHGSDWATIGGHLGRSASSVKDRCRLMKDTCKSGKWFPEEEHRLASAVYDLSGCKPGDSITSGLSWSLVAERVATRSEKQCRTKWLNYLNWKHRGGAEWTRDDDVYLIQSIINADVMEESDLDWLELSKGWPSARSPQWLRAKWWTLKRHVPDFQLLPFTDLLTCLKKIHVENQVSPKSRNSNVSHNNVKSPKQTVMNTPNLQTVTMPNNITALPLNGSEMLASHLSGIVSSSQDIEATANVNGMVHSLINSNGILQNSVIRGLANAGALLISSPTGIGLDHIVVQAVTNQFIGNGNMAVQMNSQSPLIIQPNFSTNVSEMNLNNVSSLQTSALQSQKLNFSCISEEVMQNNLTCITIPNEGTNQNNLTCITVPNEQVIQNNLTCINVPNQDIIHNNLTCITIPNDERVNMDQHSQDLMKEGNSLMMNDENSNNSNSLRSVSNTALDIENCSVVTYSQNNSNDSDLLQMNSLSDPMLMSETSDLIENETYLDNDKNVITPEVSSYV